MATETNPMKLLPCPFCGGEPVLKFAKPEDFVWGLMVPWWLVRCDHCGIAMPRDKFTTKEQAVQAWNTRNGELRSAECEVCGGEVVYVEFPQCNCCAADRRTEEESRHQ